MKILKKAMVLSAIVALTIGYSAKSFAAGTAVVDLDKVRENYTAAQELSAETSLKEAELQKFVTDAQKQIDDAKTPVEKKNLQDKLGAMFNEKRNAYVKDQAEKWGKIEDDVLKAINEISASKSYDLVLNKQVVITGGCDITTQVLDKLNKTSIKK